MTVETEIKKPSTEIREEMIRTISDSSLKIDTKMNLMNLVFELSDSAYTEGANMVKDLAKEIYSK